MDGLDITLMPQADLAAFRARTIGIVFQQFHLLQTLTALENVSLPLEIAGTKGGILSMKAAEAEALARLEAVGLGSRASHLPSQLSGGFAAARGPSDGNGLGGCRREIKAA